MRACLSIDFRDFMSSFHTQGPWAILCLLILTLGTAACDAATSTSTPPNDLLEDSGTLEDVVPVEDTPSVADTSPHPDAPSVEDVAVLVDTAEPIDTAEPEDTAEPDIVEVPDIVEEDLAGVKLTWKKDIEAISLSKCDNCHGKDGSHGLKLYTKQKWIDYFPMIIPALEKGAMPQGTSLAPGQLEDIILWGKVGYP